MADITQIKVGTTTYDLRDASKTLVYSNNSIFGLNQSSKISASANTTTTVGTYPGETEASTMAACTTFVVYIPLHAQCTTVGSVFVDLYNGSSAVAATRFYLGRTGVDWINAWTFVIAGSSISNAYERINPTMALTNVWGQGRVIGFKNALDFA